jgi:hypothetical protein
MSSLNTHKILGEWEEVYGTYMVTPGLFPGMPPEFYQGEKAIYYQTHKPRKGSPEEGYIVKVKMGEGSNLNCASCDSVYKVKRWDSCSYDEMEDCIVEYEEEDWCEGKIIPSRCRLNEVYNIKETRAIIDKHGLSGNASEIVKCLRDGLDPEKDVSYKELCLGVILNHFNELNKYLNLLPTGMPYKRILRSLMDEHNSEESIKTDEV